MTSDASTPAEQPEKEELLFALHHRDKPTLAFVECKSNAKRDELEAWLQQELPEYQFYTLDVTPLTVSSLLRTLEENLPPVVRDAPPVSYVVNVYGLENRLDEALAAQLNLERELLFRRVPYIILVWADAYFFRKLQRLAPDLWHWVTYKFRFDDPTVRPAEELPPLPEQPLPQKSNIGARREQIQALEERYSHLDLSDNNKLRLLRDKLTIKSLLAAEYAEAFEFPQAIMAYREALGLDEQIQAVDAPPDTYQRGFLFFRLGWAYYRSGLFDEALTVYKQSQILIPEEYGTISHNIGMVFAEQYQWEQALESYVQALEWGKQIAHFELGSTYHQIGMVYAEQEQWALALENYETALEWERKINNISGLGKTYHQIGRLYQARRQWKQAINSYEQAIEWKHQAGSNFDLGSTYHQIGMTYAEQEQWAAALDNYEQAVKWKLQTGNTFEVASTYHQIGKLYFDQNQPVEALLWFEKSLASAANHPNRPLAEAAVARVREVLNNPSPE